MIKLTIKQYATNNQVTTQHVYKLINSGKLEAYEQNGTKYILIDDNLQYKELATDLQQEIKILKKEIELQNKLIDSLQYQQSLFGKLLEKPKDMEVSQVAKKDTKKKKNKKKKNKKKKSKK